MTTIITNNKTVEEIKKCMELAVKKSTLSGTMLINDNQFLSEFKSFIKKNDFLSDKNISITRSFKVSDAFHLRTLFYEDKKESLYLTLDLSSRHIESVNLLKKVHDKGISAHYDFADYFNANRLLVQFDLHNHGHSIYIDDNDLYVESTREGIHHDNIALNEVNSFGELFSAISKCSGCSIIADDISNFLFNNTKIKKETLDTFSLLHDIDLSLLAQYKDFFIDVKKLDYQMLNNKKYENINKLIHK